MTMVILLTFMNMLCSFGYFVTNLRTSSRGPEGSSPLYQYLGWMVDVPLFKVVPSTPLLDTGQR
jgi:hypothetical protein